MRERTVAGKSFVTRRALFDIVRAAVQGSYGVTSFSDPSFGRRLLRVAGLDRPGIRMQTEGGLTLELYVKVAHGMPVAEVARQVDSAVRYSLRKMAGVEVASLTVHVDGLGYQPTAVQRAEAIEREMEVESIELPEPARKAGAKAAGKAAAESAGKAAARDQAHRAPAAGETAARRPKTR
jgi:uncharacterized alkaline shock family protein YloU